MNSSTQQTNPARRRMIRSTGVAAAALAATAIIRAQSNEIVVGCAASHTSWMEKLVIPHMKAKLNLSVIFEGTKSSTNLEKMVANKDKPTLSVVQMDDPVMIQAVEQGLLTPIKAANVANVAKLRKGAVHMDGMCAICHYARGNVSTCIFLPPDCFVVTN
jgi:putative spermidine/putrescine transport system substrate-binding protein